MLEKVRFRIVLFLCRSVQILRVLFYRVLSTNSINGSPRRLQPIQSVGNGQITISDSVKVGVFPSAFFFTSYAYLEARSKSASILIGDGTWLNNNFSAIAEHTKISIGRNCLIGTGVEIFDSDFHGIRIDERRVSKPEWAKPVFIGDDVFIGSNVKILKGVSIGDGSVIANGSLVTKDIPEGVIAGGFPAKVIRVID